MASLRWEWIEGDILTIPGDFHQERPDTSVSRLVKWRLIWSQSIERRSAYVFPGRWDLNTHFHDGSWGKLKTRPRREFGRHRLGDPRFA